MSSSTIQQVYVAGAGHMGHGIAQVIATAGVGVTLYDINDAALNAGLDKIRWSLTKLHEKARLAEPPQAVLARITPTTALQPAATAQLVIEVVPEREPIKRELFTGLDALCPPQVIFASNTSAIPITQLAAVTRRPDRFCGMHFFGPVQLMALVEVIRGLGTSDATVSAAMEFARRIGKTPVLVQRDAAGFIVNRVLMAAIGEAARLAESGLATPGDIDLAMQAGCNWKMGPLATADLAGLDIVLHAFEAIHADTHDPVFNPPTILRRLVAAGHLGRKTGKGFYDHARS
jgi:3-hydroxybutyryl-CoA dehydrogenase